MKTSILAGLLLVLPLAKADPTLARSHFGKMLCALALSTTFTSSFGADAAEAPLIAQLDQRLQGVRDEKRQILKSLEPGSFRERFYVTHANRPVFAEREQTLKSHLRSIRQDYLDALDKFRVTESSIPRDQMKAYQEFAPKFASVLDEISAVWFVDVDLNSFGSLGGQRSLLKTDEIAAIALTPFDFTVGFQASCETKGLSGLILFHNPRTGRIERFHAYKKGLAVTAIEPDGSVQLREAYKVGVSSAFDPRDTRWVVTEPEYMHSSASIYNPDSARIEVKRGSYRAGVAGVFNPSTRQVEWNEVSRAGVAGYYDPTQDKVVWMSSHRSGVSCVWRDNDGHYDYSYGFTATVVK